MIVSQSLARAAVSPGLTTGMDKGYNRLPILAGVVKLVNTADLKEIEHRVAKAPV